jgi:hypothetical protein
VYLLQAAIDALVVKLRLRLAVEEARKGCWLIPRAPLHVIKWLVIAGMKSLNDSFRVRSRTMTCMIVREYYGSKRQD